MDTSNSMPDDAPRGREWLVDTMAGQAQAIDLLVEMAGERIQLFDIDLSQAGWSGTKRAEALARFLRRRHAQFDVIVHDTRWIEAHAPRFVMLLRQFGHAMTLYRTGAEARSAMDPLLLVDRRHYLHRFHADQPRASAAVEAPQSAKPLVARFEEIWSTGEPGLAGTVLGL